jgi:hypothetical protein
MRTPTGEGGRRRRERDWGTRAPVGVGVGGVKCRPPQPAAHRTAGFGPAERMERLLGWFQRFSAQPNRLLVDVLKWSWHCLDGRGKYLP